MSETPSHAQFRPLMKYCLFTCDCDLSQSSFTYISPLNSSLIRILLLYAPITSTPPLLSVSNHTLSLSFHLCSSPPTAEYRMPSTTR